jgi:hypothetical protein
MHGTIESFNQRAEEMKALVVGVVEAAYLLGDPKRTQSYFRAEEYECRDGGEQILISANIMVSRVIGRGRTAFSTAPVFSLANGFAELDGRIRTMLNALGFVVVGISVGYLTEDDCWGLLIGVET